MSLPSDTGAKSPLEAAQKIVSELKDMTAEDQSLALKFAIETLRLPLPAAMSSAATAPIQALSNVASNLSSGTDHSTDIRSFTAMKSPKSDQQFSAVVAYFYQFEAKPEDRKDSIDADTMKEAARLAGRPQVTRWAMTLTNAKNAGYLDSSGHGRFKLSSVGENLVAITLPGDGPVANGRSSGTGRKSTSKAPKKNQKKKR